MPWNSVFRVNLVHLIFMTSFFKERYSGEFQVRKRAVMIHVSNNKGDRLQGVEVNVKQVSKDFPFGSAIAKTILGNGAYQVRLLSF